MRDLLLISGYGDNGGGLYAYDGVRLFVIDFLMTRACFIQTRLCFGLHQSKVRMVLGAAF